MSSLLSKRVSHAPKHRDSAPSSAVSRAVRPAVIYPGVAAIATGVAVSGGMLAPQAIASPAMASATEQTPQRFVAASLDRTVQVSRSTDDRREEADRVVKQEALSNDAGVARTKVEKINPTDVKSLAQALMPEFGLAPSEFGCLDQIWTQESGWNVHADNPSSSAYGIPQALPGSKMSSAGPDWENNATTQIKWGLGYVRDRYGSACSAAGFKAGHGWY